jgi:hypothetical protein
MKMDLRALSTGRRPPAFLLLLVMAVVCFPALSVAQSSGDASPAAQGIEERWGIQILGIRRTAGGFMLDFRYRVTDAEKASPLFRRQDKPYLIAQETGARLLVPSPPKTGPLRTSDPPEEGRIYWMFFSNPGRFVPRGARVTVVIGGFRAENLTVE